MTREQIIDILKQPFCWALLSDNERGIARSIGKENFKKCFGLDDETDEPMWRAGDFAAMWTYVLSPDWQDKPKEVEPPLIIVNETNDLVNFDSSQGGISPEKALDVAIKIIQAAIHILRKGDLK